MLFSSGGCAWARPRDCESGGLLTGGEGVDLLGAAPRERTLPFRAMPGAVAVGLEGQQGFIKWGLQPECWWAWSRRPGPPQTENPGVERGGDRTTSAGLSSLGLCP